MSIMAARLQAMIATLDGMLEYDRALEPESQPVTSCDCGDYCAWCRPEMFTSTAVRVTVDSGWKSQDIREWVDAFFSHPERIQIKRFEVKR